MTEATPALTTTIQSNLFNWSTKSVVSSIFVILANFSTDEQHSKYYSLVEAWRVFSSFCGCRQFSPDLHEDHSKLYTSHCYIQVHATAHDVFPAVIKEKEAIKSIVVPVHDPTVEVLEQETPAAAEQPTSPKSSFVAVS